MRLPITATINKTDNGNGTFTVSITFTDTALATVGATSLVFPASAPAADVISWLQAQAKSAVLNAFTVSEIPNGVTTIQYGFPATVRAVDTL